MSEDFKKKYEISSKTSRHYRVNDTVNSSINAFIIMKFDLKSLSL